MSFYDNIIAERLGGRNFGKAEKIYKFVKIKLAKDEAIKAHPERAMIDMGVGEPDKPADPRVVERLYKEAGKPENRFYSDNGIAEFQQAACKYMADVYGVTGLDPEKNVIHGIGSKPILALLPLCVINPGDVLLATTPGYGVTGTYTEYLGGEVYKLPINEDNDFFPDLDNIPADILKRAKMLYINYPNNPTGKTATVEFYKKVVDFAKKNEVLVVQDAAYAALVYDDNKPLSFLSVPGAMEVGVEIHSLSKAFNMTGWRLAFIAGDEKIIKAYGTVKDNTDSGQFRAIQYAGIEAFSHPDITENTVAKYSRRMDLLVNTLNEAGFNAKKSGGTFYCYVKSPVSAGDGTVFNSAEDAAEYIIKNASISTVPWDDSGAYLRFSVTYEAADEGDEKRIMQEVKRRLSSLDLKF